MSRTMTVDDVARFFRVHKKTIYLWRRRDPNFPRGFKKFSTLRFLASEIEQYWAGNPYRPPEENLALENEDAPKQNVDKMSPV